MKTFLVIGLGRFGTNVAQKLFELGHEVMVIDEGEEAVQRIADSVTHAVVGDARDEEVLRSIGVREYDCAIVAIGDDLASSVLITLTLKEAGVPLVICKAQNEAYRKALLKVGADRVVIPERESAIKLAQSITSENFMDSLELSSTHSITEALVPAAWIGKSILEIDVRRKFGLDIIAIRRNQQMNVSPDPKQPFAPGDVLVLLGRNEDLARVQRL